MAGIFILGLCHRLTSFIKAVQHNTIEMKGRLTLHIFRMGAALRLCHIIRPDLEYTIIPSILYYLLGRTGDWIAKRK